ncbi:MAG: hypothetical protein P4M12_11475 [Gammaproteobacteria bacterium]|nr:hypothetical protein [Gammaproteobacteria bacterium]
MTNRYQPPTAEELQQFWNNLDNIYDGTNGKRLTQIQLLKKINEKKSLPTNVLLGILFFLLKDIAHENNSYGMFKSGSTLLKRLEKVLKISNTNKPSDANKIIYLSDLQKYINENNIILPGYINSQTLCNEINIFLKKLIDKSVADITILLKKRPSAEAFLKNFAALPDEYNKNKKSNSVREKHIDFIKALEEQCIENRLGVEQIFSSFGYAVRFGALLYIMTLIESEYLLTSPENSYLYRLCQQATNIHRTSDVSPLDKFLYFSEFFNFIPKINPVHHEHNCWQDKGFREGKNFFLDMQKTLTELMKSQLALIDNTDTHPHLARVREMILSTTQFGVSLCSPNVAKNLLEFDLAKNVISGGAGMLGFAFYGPQGAIIASQLGALVEERLIPTTIHRITGKIFQKIGTVVGQTTGQVVYLTFSLPLDAFHSFLGLTGIMNRKKNNGDLKPYDDKEWIMALLNLPDSVFPESKKTVIRSVELIPEITPIIANDQSAFKIEPRSSTSIRL